MQRVAILLFLFLTPSLSAHAESRYVTDQILIALRPAENDTAEPLEYLPTGMRVDVVEDLGPYLKIKTATGKVGFARSKYFVPTPPRRAASAENAQGELAAALKKIAELTAELEQLRLQPKELISAAQMQEQEKVRTESAAIKEERDQLKAEVARLNEEIEKRSPAAPAAETGGQLQWFLAGAATLLLGWFAGKSSRAKRYY